MFYSFIHRKLIPSRSCEGCKYILFYNRYLCRISMKIYYYYYRGGLGSKKCLCFDIRCSGYRDMMKLTLSRAFFEFVWEILSNLTRIDLKIDRHFHVRIVYIPFYLDF